MRSSGITEPRREAGSLLGFVLQKDRSFLIAHPEYRLSEAEQESFENVVFRRSRREPFQYITSRQEFFGLDFDVMPGVLIPRPETEILVASSIAIISDSNTKRLCEIGVGSGCISVSILHQVAGATAVGVDISRPALELAAKNAATHGVEDRLELRESDLFACIEFTFDLIVSNPPYIPASDLESLQIEVERFEPHSALFAGEEGLDVIERIVAEAPAFLNPGGWLMIEIGIDQAARVDQLFNRSFWEGVEFIPDLQTIPRVVKARLCLP